ncbi:hypothetical protein H0A36_02100 [Endozoicomonas sp. SM1973]|uniref:Uncharacterized protein n=1 Tax=Spartinivicinus marinus TaxID=2994442 RepID=A0A853HSL9_9GAMM|nr:hypothetical protein [Spartinivicinus marinus]MCX4029976.1 hypothetical protein [Spartinivicinus marinus]NYZ64780.1 hypothetical protein [Spartinivicinus marinus]
MAVSLGVQRVGCEINQVNLTCQAICLASCCRVWLYLTAEWITSVLILMLLLVSEDQANPLNFNQDLEK